MSGQECNALLAKLHAASREPKTMNDLDKLNKAYDLHKDSFNQSSFHTTLWEVLMNNVFAGKIIAFTNNYLDKGNQLGIAVANESGYCPTPAYFNSDINHDKVSDIVDSLNEIVFGLNPDTALNIVASSMRRGNIKAA